MRWVINVSNLSRSEARSEAMTILYQLYLYKKNKINGDIEELFNDSKISNDDFGKSLVMGVIDNNDMIVDLANKYLNNWTINRLGFTDQAIISIGIYELLKTDTPPKVIINEAIELAHEYSDEKVVKMINSVLDRVYHNECE